MILKNHFRYVEEKMNKFVQFAKRFVPFYKMRQELNLLHEKIKELDYVRRNQYIFLEHIRSDMVRCTKELRKLSNILEKDKNSEAEQLAKREKFWKSPGLPRE